jgi:MoxR-like ATPase
MNFKPKQSRFIEALIATSCPDHASYADLLAAAEHGGWSCIPAWVRTDVNRKSGRGMWDVSDLLSGLPSKSAQAIQRPAPSVPVSAPVAAPAVPTMTPDSTLALSMTAGESESLVPSKISTYVPWGNFDDVERIIASGMFYPVFITGLSGNGKTTMVDQVCAKQQRELFRVNITAATDEDDLLGGFRLINGDTVWQDGPVVSAMKRGAVLLLDEIDLASHQIMCLQPVLEGKGVFLKKIGIFVKPTDGFTIFATANTKGKGDESGKFTSTNILNEAFLDRFPVTLEQDYASKTIEKKIVLKVMKSLKAEDADFAKNLVEWSDMIRKCYAEDAVDEIITTRRLVNIATAFSIFKDRMKALELATARFDTTTREAFLSMYGKIDATVRPEEDPAEPEIIFEDGSNLPGATLIYLDCPFGEKDQVKVLGGMWDQAAKKWVVAIEVIRLNPDRFSKWTQRYHDENNVAHIIRTA